MIPAAEPAGNMKKFLTIWGGQVISILGSGLTNFALSVWIYDRTHQATPFALTLVFSTLPFVLIAPLAGSLADRWNRRRIMILADTFNALVTLAAAILLWTDNLQVIHVYLMAALGSAFSAFQEPAYSASVTMLVPKDQLGRANGLIQMGHAGANLLAPVLAGLLYYSIGFRWIVVIDITTFLIAVGALLITFIPQPKPDASLGSAKTAFLTDLTFGWNYLRERPGLMSLLWYFTLTNFLLNLATVLLVPGVLTLADSRVLGLVLTASGAGMLLGSLALSAWGGPKRGKIATVIGFVSMAAASFWLAGALAAVWAMAAGFFILMFCIPFGSGISSSLMQIKVAPAVQGRVFGIRATITRSAMPLAMLLAGPLADYVFGPWMMPGGLLAETFIGRLLGVGPQRGIGLLFVLSGTILLIVSAFVIANPRVRNLETELPDAQTTTAEG